MVQQVAPFCNVALLCQRAFVDENGDLQLQGLFDVFGIGKPTVPGNGHGGDHFDLDGYLVVGINPGSSPRSGHLRVIIENPPDTLADFAFEKTLDFQGPFSTNYALLHMKLKARSAGSYWLVATFNGRQMARIPLIFQIIDPFPGSRTPTTVT